MNWWYVVVVYDSAGRPKGYLSEEVGSGVIASTPKLLEASRFTLEAKADRLRSWYTPPERGWYTAIEMRAFR